ncbi:MAG: protein translocase subunit SecD [Candidatus Cloacimonadota bacterium]|nr:MAG: protein translocase subunit SecD [Candidatus Cloacimonadota bacterium]
MKKSKWRTFLIIAVVLVTIYYLLPLMFTRDTVVCNIEIYDQSDSLLKSITGEEYRVGSKKYGDKIDEMLAKTKTNEFLEIRTIIPADVLADVKVSPEKLQQMQTVKINVKNLKSEVTLPSWFSHKTLKLGLDLQGGMHLVMEVDTSELPKKDAEYAVKSALEIIRNRIDQFGVSEPNIQLIGDNRILVQLPGLHDPKRAKNLIGKTALLEFKLVAKSDDIKKAIENLDQYFQENYSKYAFLQEVKEGEEAAVESSLLEDVKDENIEKEKVENENIEQKKEDESKKSEEEIEQKEENQHSKVFSSLLASSQNELIVENENLPVINKIIKLPELDKILPEGIQILLGKANLEDPYGPRPIFFLYKNTELTGKYLKTADVSIGQGMDPRTANKPYVSLEFNNEGAEIFARVTEKNVKERLAIVLDNVVHSAPVINQRIAGGRAQITGNFTMKEAKDLAIVLRAGKLPAPVEIIEERTIGPSLGSDSIKAGFISAIVGLIIVILFMMVYYKAAGFIADIALVFNMVIILAVLTMFRATLTMPGIAGIILTIGMSVDANVLIFARIREELKKKRGIRSAIDNGYKRAIITILDANITTLITAVVLYQFGTGPIRGFAVTLSIGIIASMFTAILLTRAIFDAFILNKQRKTLSI